jgi:hypothetical protein
VPAGSGLSYDMSGVIVTANSADFVGSVTDVPVTVALNVVGYLSFVLKPFAVL